MIQAVMLIALGFLTASLVGVIVAPALWHRAYRLSRKRLEQTLPVALSEIEAAQDQLKASYAVRMRRLETALASAKRKAAMQLVDNSRLQMQIAALKDEITDLDLKLSERQNAAAVLEQTITRRFPELDREIVGVKAQLQERSYAIQDLSNKLSRRNEELEAAQRAARLYQDELDQLHQALEKNSAERSGRRVRRASKWSLEDYRVEYDRLNLELSKLRQQLAHLQEKDAQQSNVIKEELQKLAELILVSSQPKTEADAHRPEPAAKRAGPPDLRRDRPVPWPESVFPLAVAPRGAPDALEDGVEAAEKQERRKQPAGAALATVFGPLPDAAGKPGAGNGSQEAAGAPRGARSKLLREALPEIAAPINVAASGAKEEASAAVANGPKSESPEEESGLETVNGSSPGTSGGAMDEESAKLRLAERLRGAGRE